MHTLGCINLGLTVVGFGLCEFRLEVRRTISRHFVHQNIRSGNGPDVLDLPSQKRKKKAELKIKNDTKYKTKTIRLKQIAKSKV
jgi:hypothetical protein